MQTIRIRGLEHASPQEALVELNFSGDRAISLAGRYFTVDQSELDRIEAAGFQPTLWTHNEATSRIMSVPGRH